MINFRNSGRMARSLASSVPRGGGGEHEISLPGQSHLSFKSNFLNLPALCVISFSSKASFPASDRLSLT